MVVEVSTTLAEVVATMVVEAVALEEVVGMISSKVAAQVEAGGKPTTLTTACDCARQCQRTK